MGYWIRCHYLDASALVKLVADDDHEAPGRDALRNYYWKNTANVYSTSHSVTEALAVLKGKYRRGDFDRTTYQDCVDKFLTRFLGSNLRIRDDEEILPLYSPIVTNEATRMIDAYDIDFLDAFQLVVLARGYFRHMTGGSKSLLITADRGLAKAARGENLDVWCCLDDAAPTQTELPE